MISRRNLLNNEATEQMGSVRVAVQGVCLSGHYLANGLIERPGWPTLSICVLFL